MAPQPHQSPHGTASTRSRILEVLLKRHGDRLRRQARRHSEFVQDAEDALADACVAYLRGYEGHLSETDSLHWMLVTVRHSAWEISKRRRRRESLHPSVAIELAVDPIPTPAPGPAEAAERAAEVRRVMAAISLLSEDDRDALILVGLGYSYEEIADLRGWSRAKVHRRLSEGRARVRQILEEGGNTS